MVTKSIVAVMGAALVAAPALAGDAPRLSQAELSAAHYSAKSGEPRFCRLVRDAGDTRVQTRCATRAEWREFGVTIVKR